MTGQKDKQRFCIDCGWPEDTHRSYDACAQFNPELSTVPILTILNDAVDRTIEGGPEPLREALRSLSNDELNTFYYQLAEIRGEVTTVLMERNAELPSLG